MSTTTISTTPPLKDTLFTTSVWSWQLPHVDCHQMAEKVRELYRADPGRTASNRLGWQSNSMNNRDLPLWLSATVNAVRDRMLTPIYQELGLARTPQLANFWYNVNPPGAFNWTHTHPNSSFSSVIYLENTAGSGPIVFENTQAIPGTLAERAILPREGTVLMFPATTPHRVEPNLSKTDRITIAVNWI